MRIVVSFMKERVQVPDTVAKIYLKFRSPKKAPNPTSVKAAGSNLISKITTESPQKIPLLASLIMITVWKGMLKEIPDGTCFNNEDPRGPVCNAHKL